MGRNMVEVTAAAADPKIVATGTTLDVGGSEYSTTPSLTTIYAQQWRLFPIRVTPFALDYHRLTAFQ